MNRRAENIGPKTSATATAARISFRRHAVGENGAPRRSRICNQNGAPHRRTFAVENYRKRLKNATIEPEAGARNAPGDELDRSRAAGAARYQP